MEASIQKEEGEKEKEEEGEEEDNSKEEDEELHGYGVLPFHHHGLSFSYS